MWQPCCKVLSTFAERKHNTMKRFSKTLRDLQHEDYSRSLNFHPLVDNGPMCWLFAIIFLVTTKSVKRSRWFESQYFSVFSYSERYRRGRTTDEIPGKYTLTRVNFSVFNDSRLCFSCQTNIIMVIIEVLPSMARDPLIDNGYTTVLVSLELLRRWFISIHLKLIKIILKLFIF
jgi:hypothetical protein